MSGDGAGKFLRLSDHRTVFRAEARLNDPVEHFASGDFQLFHLAVCAVQPFFVAA